MRLADASTSSFCAVQGPSSGRVTIAVTNASTREVSCALIAALVHTAFFLSGLNAMRLDFSKLFTVKQSRFKCQFVDYIIEKFLERRKHAHNYSDATGSGKIAVVFELLTY